MTPTLNLSLLLTSLLSPAALSVVGSTLSGILAQDGFPKWLNGLIAWIVLLAAAVASVIVANHFDSFSGFIDAVIAAVSLLLSGGLHSLKPWTDGWLAWVQSHLFNIVKAPAAALSGPRLATGGRASSAYAPGATPIPQRASLMKPPPNQDSGG